MLAFRPADTALLQRLEDEQLTERLWRWHMGKAAAGKTPPHPRAAGLVHLLRALPGGDAAVGAALSGELRPLAHALQPKSVRAFPPALHHHAALYFAKVADALEAEHPKSALFFRTQSLASWLALAEEQSYLRGLAEAIVAGALPEVEVHRAADDAPFEPIDALGKRAMAGARELDVPSAMAMAALAEVKEACAIAACDGASPAPPGRGPHQGEKVAAAATSRASLRRGAAIETALAPIEGALDEASAQEETGKGDARLPILARVLDVWRWSGQDEAVERFAVDRAQPVGWNIYRAGRWEDLRRLLAVTAPLVDSLATRIERTKNLAYAAGCAEMLVFQAQTEEGLHEQTQTAERALRVCPSHRNARVILADYLCEAAIRRLSTRGGFVSAAEVSAAEAEIARATELFPSSNRLASAKEKLRRVRGSR